MHSGRKTGYNYDHADFSRLFNFKGAKTTTRIKRAPTSPPTKRNSKGPTTKRVSGTSLYRRATSPDNTLKPTLTRHRIRERKGDCASLGTFASCAPAPTAANIQSAHSRLNTAGIEITARCSRTSPSATRDERHSRTRCEQAKATAGASKGPLSALLRVPQFHSAACYLKATCAHRSSDPERVECRATYCPSRPIIVDSALVNYTSLFCSTKGGEQPPACRA